MTNNSKIKFETKTIGPKEAKEMLERIHPKQRSVVKASVKRYTEAMKAGKWSLSPSGIVFDSQGFMVDGQHRLLAVVESGTTQEFTVGYLPPGADMHCIDRGRSRTLGDILEISGDVNRGEGKRLASVAKFLYGISIDNPEPRDFESKVTDILAKSKPHIDGASEGNRKFLAHAWKIAPFAYAYPCNPEAVRDLIHRVSENDSLERQTGAWHLYNILAENGHDRSSWKALENMYRILRCIQLHLEGGKLNTVRPRGSSKNGDVDVTPTALTYFRNLRENLGIGKDVL